MKIQHKIFLFLFGFSLILVSILVILMQWSIGKGMIEYVVSKEIETLKPVFSELTSQYREHNSWQFIAGKHHKLRGLINQSLDDTDFDPEQPPRRVDRRFEEVEDMPPHRQDRASGYRNGPPKERNQAHFALLDADKELIAGNLSDNLVYVKTPITVNNRVVGYFAVSKRNQLTQGYEVDFINQQQHYLWLIALLVMLLVVLVTLPLARHVVEPIKQIIQGMHKLTQGEFHHTITLNRKDELSDLSRDYNELALTLSANETARKRWLANTSHELRTPVAILRGELEAMLDEVRPMTMDNIASANDEVKHLQRLIDDLNLLTSADIGGMNYRKEHLSLLSLIENEQSKFHTYLADAGILFTLESKQLRQKAKNVTVYADETRLLQLFENIINNCLKYSSASQLNLLITVDDTQGINNSDNGVVHIRFEDNGVGVEDSHLPHLFEHLYRVEDSRNRQTGGSGLGLSICRQIVIGHQGTIVAEKSNSGGLAVIITLPLA